MVYGSMFYRTGVIATVCSLNGVFRAPEVHVVAVSVTFLLLNSLNIKANVYLF